MKRTKFLSLLLALVLAFNFSCCSAETTTELGSATTEENPLDFAFNDH